MSKAVVQWVMALAPLLVLLTCTTGGNPYGDPDNVQVTATVDTNECLAGDTVTVAMRVYLPDLVDSVLVEFGTGNDTVFTLGGPVLNNEATVALNHVFADTGTITIRYTAYCTSQILKGGTLTIHVSARPTQPGNARPAFVAGYPATSYQIDEGALLSIALKATDGDGDQVSFFVDGTTLPRPTTVSLADSTLVWQSQEGDLGLYRITIGATDGADTTEAVVDIAVGDVNLPPRITVGAYERGDTVHVTEGCTLSLTVTAEDPNAADSVSLLPAANAPYDVADAGDGSFSVETGVFTYVPSFGVSSPDGNHTFSDVTFIAFDNGRPVGSDTFVVHIVVADSNRAPAAYNGSVSTDEETAVSFELQAADPESASLVWSITDSTDHGDVSGTAPQLTYTPEADFTGADTLRFEVGDGVRLSNVGVFVINVGAQNDPPVVQSKAVSTKEDTPLAITLEATDPDNTSFIWIITSNPSHGKLSGTPPDLTYTPDKDYSGFDSFAFQANDSLNTSNVATISIGISAVNDAPAVSLTSPSSGASFVYGTAIVIQASVSDADGAGDIKSVSFYVGTSLLNQDTQTPYAYTWQNARGDQSYVVKAKVEDDSGAVAWDSVNVEVRYTYQTDSLAVAEILGENLSIVSVAEATRVANGRIHALIPSPYETLDLGDIPPCLGNLTALDTLDCTGYHGITSLPTEIGYLVNLDVLSIRGNLQQVPSSIGDLTNLRHFHIYMASLSTLPDEIGLLTKIEVLSLLNDGLDSLPETITNLSPTRACYLDQNRLCDLSTALKAWADTYDPDWQSSQTCP